MKQIRPIETLYQHPVKKTLAWAGEACVYNVPSLIGYNYLENCDYSAPELVVTDENRVNLAFWLEGLDKTDAKPRKIYKYYKGKTKTYQIPIPKTFLQYLKFTDIKSTKVAFRIARDEISKNRVILLGTE